MDKLSFVAVSLAWTFLAGMDTAFADSVASRAVEMHYHTRHIPERQLDLQTPVGAEVKANGLCDVLDEPYCSCMKKYGIDVIETRCVWYEVEKSPGVFDFSPVRKDVEAIRAKGFRAGIFPWWMHPPKWEHGIVRARCLEHGKESSIVSLWDERTLQTYDRLYAALARELGGSIDFLYICIYGDFGEPQYLHNTKHYVFSSPHAHFGLWCGDPLARASFRKFVAGKYGTVAALNAAWGASFGSFDDDLMAWRENIRFRLDFQKWYTDCLMEFTDKACAIARKHFPTIRMGMPIGCRSECLVLGQTKSTVAKICAKYGIVARCTTLADFPDFARSQVVTRRIASAARFYGTEFGVESPLTLAESTAYTANYQIIANGTSLVHNDPGNIYRASKVYMKFRDVPGPLPFTCDYAAFYPVEGEKCGHRAEFAEAANDHSINPAALFDELAALRKSVDYDIVDSVMIDDGFLESRPKLVLVRNVELTRATADRIAAYRQQGGEVLYVASAPPTILETGERFVCGTPLADYADLRAPDGKFYTDHGDRISVYDEARHEILFQQKPRPATTCSGRPDSPYGATAHVSRDEFKDRARTFEAAKKAGLTWLRTDFLWREIELKEGEWDFSRYDALVDDAEKAGIRLLPILDYDTLWSRPAWRNLDKWGLFVRRLVTRYKDRLRVWEVWNEQNADSMWRDTADAGHYAILLKYTYNLIKGIDPSLVVVFGGTAGVPFDFIEGVFKAGGGPFFDVMNIHPYTRPQPPEGILDVNYERLKTLMGKYGLGEKPIWVTENGWPTHRPTVNEGVLRAGLALARPNQKTWRVLYAPLPCAGGRLPDDGLLEAYRRVFPKGSTVALATPGELVKAMDADAVDCVIYPAQDFIGATMDSLIAFVARGGVLMQCGGMPMWWPQRVLPSGLAVRDTSIPGEPYRRRLRLRPEACWSDKALYDGMLVRPTPATVGFEPTNAVYRCSHFVTTKYLKPGDELIPLLVGKDRKGRPAVGAGVYRFNSDMKGAIILCNVQKGRGGTTKAAQAALAVRALAISFAEGVGKYLWYELRSREGGVAHEPEDHFGLIEADWTEKPAFAATAEFIRRRPAGSVQLDVPWHSRGRTCYHPQWTRPDGTVAGVAWMIDGLDEPVVFVFDRPGAAFADLFGKTMRTVPDGNPCRVRVSFGDSPLYFEGARLLRIEASPKPAACDWKATLAPTRSGAVFGPDESVTMECRMASRKKGAVPSVRAIRVAVTDVWGGIVLEKEMAPAGKNISFHPTDLKNRFGAMKVTATCVCSEGAEVPVEGETWFARLTSDTVRPCRWVGVNMHGWGYGPHRYEMAAKAGIGTVRNHPRWADCEREKGIYTETPGLAEDLAHMKRLGLSLNCILCYGNKIYENELDPAAFGNWIEHFATAHKDDIDVFEIWNEGYNFGFHKKYGGRWTQEFSAFTRQAAERLYRCRPDATVVVASEDGFHGLARMLTHGIAKKGDCVSFHPYSHGKDMRPERLNFFFKDDGREIKELARDNGGADRFRITEVGWTTFRRDEGATQAAWAGYAPASYLEQAQYVVRAFLIARMNGVESMMQYDFSNDGNKINYTEHNFGLCFRACQMPKPSYAAVAEMTRLLGDAEPVADETVDRRLGRLYRFRRPDGQIVLVGWAIEAPVTWELPKDVPANYTLVDIQGNRKPTQGRQLALTETPVYAVFTEKGK